MVGTNKGIINAVNFSGILKAYKTVGGIAGINDDTGFILNSANYADVDGTKLVGGIAGINKGTIVSCENRGRDIWKQGGGAVGRKDCHTAGYKCGNGNIR